jgi:hypothetical protein
VHAAKQAQHQNAVAPPGSVSTAEQERKRKMDRLNEALEAVQKMEDKGGDACELHESSSTLHTTMGYSLS